MKIGVVVPLTGDSANLGEDISRTIALVQEHLQSEQLRYRYKFVIENGTCGIGNSAVTSTQKLVSIEKVSFIISGCSGETLQAAPITQANGVLLMAVASSSPKIRTLGRLVFRTYLDISTGVEKLSRQVVADDVKRLIVLTEENAFTQAIRSGLKMNLGSIISGFVDYSPEENDLRTMFLKVRANRPDAIYLNCAGPKRCALVARQAREQGIDVPFYSYFYPEHREVLAVAAKHYEGTKYFTIPTIDSAPIEFRTLMERYSVKYRSPPGTMFLAQATFDAVRALVDGIEAEGPIAQKVELFLHKYNREGALGNVQFDEHGDIKNIDYVLRKIINGKPENIKNIFK